MIELLQVAVVLLAVSQVLTAVQRTRTREWLDSHLDAFLAVESRVARLEESTAQVRSVLEEVAELIEGDGSRDAALEDAAARITRLEEEADERRDRGGSSSSVGEAPEAGRGGVDESAAAPTGPVEDRSRLRLRRSLSTTEVRLLSPAVFSGLPESTKELLELLRHGVVEVSSGDHSTRWEPTKGLHALDRLAGDGVADREPGTALGDEVALDLEKDPADIGVVAGCAESAVGGGVVDDELGHSVASCSSVVGSPEARRGGVVESVAAPTGLDRTPVVGSCSPDGCGALREWYSDGSSSVLPCTTCPSLDTGRADILRPVLEPTCIGAVVEAADGRRWVRVEPDGGRAKWLLSEAPPDFDPRYVWSAVPAVRVLSEGVGGPS